MNNLNSISKTKLETIKSLKAETIAKTLRELYNKSIDSFFIFKFEDYKKELKTFNDIIENANSVEMDKINKEWLYYQMNEKNHSKTLELAKELAIEKDKYSFLYLLYALEHLSNFNTEFELIINHLDINKTERNEIFDTKIKIANTIIKEIDENFIYLENAKRCNPDQLELYKNTLKTFNDYVDLFNNNRDEKDNIYIKLGIAKINGIDIEKIAKEKLKEVKA